MADETGKRLLWVWCWQLS